MNDEDENYDDNDDCRCSGEEICAAKVSNVVSHLLLFSVAKRHCEKKVDTLSFGGVGIGLWKFQHCI